MVDDRAIEAHVKMCPQGGTRFDDTKPRQADGLQPVQFVVVETGFPTTLVRRPEALTVVVSGVERSEEDFDNQLEGKGIEAGTHGGWPINC